MVQILPNKEEIYEMLSLLLGDDITVEYRRKPMDLTDKQVAIYADADGNPGAICCCDAAFAAFSGGAITMMPVAITQEAAEYDDLTDIMIQNLYEVMNICTRLVINDETPHLKLTTVSRSQEVEEAVNALVSTGNRGDYEIEIPKYGKGTLSFLVA